MEKLCGKWLVQKNSQSKTLVREKKPKDKKGRVDEDMDFDKTFRVI